MTSFRRKTISFAAVQPILPRLVLIFLTGVRRWDKVPAFVTPHSEKSSFTNDVAFVAISERPKDADFSPPYGIISDLSIPERISRQHLKDVTLSACKFDGGDLCRSAISARCQPSPIFITSRQITAEFQNNCIVDANVDDVNRHKLSRLVVVINRSNKPDDKPWAVSSDEILAREGNAIPCQSRLMSCHAGQNQSENADKYSSGSCNGSVVGLQKVNDSPNRAIDRTHGYYPLGL